VNALLAHTKDLAGIGGVERPGIVHRLDRDTSGLMLVAKNDASHKALSGQLARRAMGREYLALVRGVPPTGDGVIDAPIGRSPRDRKKMAVVAGGRHAVTRFTTERRLGDYTLLRLKLATGRTHQIRVHLAYLGLPVAGDPYTGGRGAAALATRRRARLVAPVPARRAPRVRPPVDGEKMVFEDDLPRDLSAALERVSDEAGPTGS